MLLLDWVFIGVIVAILVGGFVNIYIGCKEIDRQTVAELKNIRQIHKVLDPELYKKVYGKDA